MSTNSKKITKTEAIDFELLFNESIIPQGVIEVEGVENNHNFYLTKWNKIFAELASLKTTEKKQLAQQGFSFLDGFNLQPLSLYLNSNTGSEAQFIYRSAEKTFKLSLRKLNAGTLLFALENITDLQGISSELNDKRRQLKESHEIAHLGYWVENHALGNNFWSDQVYRILDEDTAGTKPSFENYLSFVDKADRKGVKEAFINAVDNKTGYEITHKLKLKNGVEKYVIQRCYTNYDFDDKPIQSVGIIQDITTHERTKEELKNSEAIFRSVFDFAPIAIVLVNDKHKPIFFNRQFSEIVGYPTEKIYERGLKDFTHPDDYSPNLEQYNRLFSGDISTFTSTKRYIRPDGSILWAKVIVSAIKNGSANPEMAIAMVQDISAEKLATEALVLSENRYRTLIENANDGIGLFDFDFKPIIFNKMLYQMLGYPLEDYLALNHKTFVLFHPDDRKLAQNAFDDVKQNKTARMEVRMSNFDGTYSFFAVSFIPVVHENDPAILIFRRNISQRKLAEQQNEEYRLFLETVMDNLPVSLFAKTTPDFRYLYWNHTIEKATGISAEEAIGKTDFELLPLKGLAEQYHNEDVKLLKTGKRFDSEHELTNTRGEISYFNTIKTIHKSNIGNPLILGISMDVTRLKDTEKQLEQSTQMLKEAQKIAKLGYWEYDVKKDLFFDNPENRQILGTEKLPYFLNFSQFSDLLHIVDRDLAGKKFKQSITEGISGEGIVRIVMGNNTKHVAIKYKPVEGLSGKVEKLRGTCLDITQIRHSEMALRQSEQRLKQAEHIAKVGYWDYDFETKVTKFSDEIWRILELVPSDTSVSLAEFFKAVHTDDKVRVAAQFQKSKNNNQPFDLEFKIATHNLNVKYIKAIGTFVRNQDGGMVRSLGTFQDISDLKINELGYENSVRKLSQVHQISKIGFIDFNIESKALSFSSNFYSIFGITDTTELRSIDDYEALIHEEDRLTITKTFDKAQKIGQGYSVQYRVKLNNGSVKNINETCFIDTLNSEKIATRIVQDITELREKDMIQEQTAKVQELMTLGTCELNVETMQFEFGPGMLKLFTSGSDRDSISFDEFINLVHIDDRSSVTHLLTKGRKLKEEFVLSFRVVAHGRIKFLQLTCNVGTNHIGESIFGGEITDITEQRALWNKLYEQTELFKAVTENALFGVVIYQDLKRIYSNKKWGELIGHPANLNLESMPLEEIYESDSVAFINELFSKWHDFNLNEYSNKISIKPLNAPEFSAEIYVKEILYNDKTAVLIITYPLSD